MEAAVYARISHVDDASTVGVDRQEADGRALVERRGWTLAQVLVDNNRSAWRRNRKRPGWDALLEAIRSRQVDVVVVAHPDRLIRQPRDLEDLLDLARDTGVQLVSAGGNRDLSNPDDVFILRIEVAHACRSSDDTSRRVRRGHEAAAAAGRPGGGTGWHRPYGFDADQLTVRADERDVVREACRRLLAGESLTSIRRDLNDRAVPTVTGVAWSTTALRGVLVSPRTAGLRSFRGELVGAASWPALLDEDDWRQACALLDRPAPPGQNRRRHLLSGLVACGQCPGEVFGAEAHKVPGYGCPVCFQRVARHLLDEHVVDEVLRRLNDATLLRSLTVSDSPDLDDDRQVVDDSTRRIERVLEDWEATGASAQWARKQVDAIKATRDAAQRRIDTATRKAAWTGMEGIDGHGWAALPLDVRRAVVADLLPDLTVVRTGRRGRGLDASRVLFESDPAQRQPAGDAPSAPSGA